MLVGSSNIHLADPAGRIVAVHLGKRTYFQPPVPGDPVDPGQIDVHAEFTGERVAEAVEEQKELVGADELLQRSYQRRDQEPRHPAVHLVRDPAVEPLAENVIEIGIHHRVAEPWPEVPGCR